MSLSNILQEIKLPEEWKNSLKTFNPNAPEGICALCGFSEELLKNLAVHTYRSGIKDYMAAMPEERKPEWGKDIITETREALQTHNDAGFQECLLLVKSIGSKLLNDYDHLL